MYAASFKFTEGKKYIKNFDPNSYSGFTQCVIKCRAVEFCGKFE